MNEMATPSKGRLAMTNRRVQGRLAMAQRQLGHSLLGQDNQRRAAFIHQFADQEFSKHLVHKQP